MFSGCETSASAPPLTLTCAAAAADFCPCACPHTPPQFVFLGLCLAGQFPASVEVQKYVGTVRTLSARSASLSCEVAVLLPCMVGLTGRVAHWLTATTCCATLGMPPSRALHVAAMTCSTCAWHPQRSRRGRSPPHKCHAGSARPALVLPVVQLPCSHPHPHCQKPFLCSTPRTLPSIRCTHSRAWSGALPRWPRRARCGAAPPSSPPFGSSSCRCSACWRASGW